MYIFVGYILMSKRVINVRIYLFIYLMFISQIRRNLLTRRNFVVLTVMSTSNQSVRSVRVIQVAIKVLEAVYPEKTLLQ